ncbi:4'-phosphopantetheinyl transferase family protein [Alloprevotella rava]|uniref:4'-phosphopantetheinyl transferase domain-containing protein n=2 Tax=Alloprevotella rava TaxID=671218 RepID=G5G918_9BACT|nr:4'-phosphopantetheinyl transferase family protein [Alloprevotella rava]EHG24803.1 hypothetical protein HMPREF9332_00068 [Alloprevotella rava F0323]MBB3703537.1 4'-phosphopantetheinyl transferase EntD [Alloprevotella rava]
MPRLLTNPHFLFDAPDILFWHATETVEELLSLLPPKQRYNEEIELFGALSRKKERLATRVLLHEALGTEANIDYLLSHRPVLTFPNKEISISHSHSYIALSTASFRHGIDIEVYGSRALKLHKAFLNESEVELLTKREPEQLATMLWSAKEAVYKFFDIQEIDFSKDILFTNYTVNTLHTYLPRFKKECIVHYFFLQDFVLTYAIQGYK